MVWDPRKSAREKTSFGAFQLHDSHLITGGGKAVEMDVSRHVRYDATTDDPKATADNPDREPGRHQALVVIGQGIEAGADWDTTEGKTEIVDALEALGIDIP